MPDTTSDQVAAYLADVRKRSERPLLSLGALPISNDAVRALMESAGDVPRLLAALEAVLEQHQPGPVVVLGDLCKHHENHRYFSITSTEAADVVACADCMATVYTSCARCGGPTPLDSCPVRADVARELLGEEAGRG